MNVVDEEEKKSADLRVRMTEDMISKTKEQAKKSGMSVSEFVRLLLARDVMESKNNF